MSWKYNPFTGKFDLVPADNFSYNIISEDKKVKVPTGQQMLVYGDLDLDGELVLDGELILFDTEHVNRIKETSASESVAIELYEVIKQINSGIITSISGAITGSEITITNRSGGDNILNLTIQGTVSPTIKDLESFSLIYNGVDYDIT